MADIRNFDPHAEVTVLELIKAVFYFLLSHSDLLVLSINCLVQVKIIDHDIHEISS